MREPLRNAVASGQPSPMRELALRAAAGDAAATGELVRAVAPRIVTAVRLVVGSNHPDLDDAVQQALIAFVQALPAYRGDCEPAGYARVIAVRTAVTVRKRARLHASRHDASGEEEELVGAEPSPREALTTARTKELWRDLLTELPSEQAETLALRVVVGCSLDEIARETGVPLNTVRSRMRLAKERLRSRIEADPALLEALEVHR
jgi:RNA polymerase sigma-70 factor (ECF subfamily)